MEEFEEDAWEWDIGVKETSNPHEQVSTPKLKKLTVSSSGSSAARNIPRRANSQTTAKEGKTTQVQQSSAPMNIPDWSKIYGRKTSSSSSWAIDNHVNGHGYGEHYHVHHHGDYHDDDDEEMVPPHEWIARKLARSQISSFSVCEGIGRTLKGRDLSKVRNAILTKTGFLE